MSSKTKKRYGLINDIVLEQRALSVGALAEVLDASTQTIRRHVDQLYAGGLLKRRHGRVEPSPWQSKTPFDQSGSNNLPEKRNIGEAAADDKTWDTSEEITISESGMDLCDGSDGGCEVVVTLTKIGVGEEDDKVIATVTAFADAN